MYQYSFPMADVHKELEKAYEPQKALCGECGFYRELTYVPQLKDSLCELCIEPEREPVAPLQTKVKKLRSDAVIPAYAKTGDSGFDLVAIDNTVVPTGGTVVIKTGLAFELPTGYEVQVRPRSGISSKTPLRVILGTIDQQYRGEVGVIVENHGPQAITVSKGTRIAQGVIAPAFTTQFVEVEELAETERGQDGFGSTGVKIE